MRAGACSVANGRDDFFHEFGPLHHHVANARSSGLLAHDVHFGCNFKWIVRANLASETILQRGDHAAAVGVILGVCRRNQHHIEWQPNFVTTDLHVAFFQHVQQAHLNALGQVGQFVDRKNAAIGAWDQAVVNGEFVAEVTAFSNLDGVYFSNQVGN